VQDVLADLISASYWRSNPPVWPEHRIYYADDSAWWREPSILGELGFARAALFSDESPTVVMGSESRGSLLGPLVATRLGIGFAEVRKGADWASDVEVWLRRCTPPDYRDRHLEMAVRRSVLRTGDRVLFVDDWAATGDWLGCRYSEYRGRTHCDAYQERCRYGLA